MFSSSVVYKELWIAGIVIVTTTAAIIVTILQL